MSYIQGNHDFKSTCDKSDVPYDSECSRTYYDTKDKSVSDQMMVYYENFLINSFLDQGEEEGVLSTYYLSDIFEKVMNIYEDYTFFLTHETGTYVLARNKDPISEYVGMPLWNALFPDDSSLSEAVELDVVPTYVNDEIESQEISGINSVYYIGASHVVVNVNRTITDKKLIAGAMINDNSLLADWDDLLVDINKTIIIQMAIFIAFLLLTLVTAWRLSKTITSRIIAPIGLIESYLRGEKSLEEIKDDYNLEVNQILNYLELLETVEKFIDPNFLLHPKHEERIKNLKEARHLFKKITNKRGLAITNNLIGNSCFQTRDYPSAVKAFKKALTSIEELKQDVEKQEEEEGKLTEEEKRTLMQKTGKAVEGWENEKKFLSDNVAERILQLCMAKIALLDDDDTVERWEKRAEWKEVMALLTRALQHYIDTRSQFIRVVSILIQISYVFQNIQYYHSAIELLEIVSDEIWKIESNNKVDIDITRLRRVGVNVKESQHMRGQQFTIDNVTFERDILQQRALYRRGMILKENDKIQEAGLAFTMAIVRAILGKRRILRS